MAKKASKNAEQKKNMLKAVTSGDSTNKIISDPTQDEKTRLSKVVIKGSTLKITFEKKREDESIEKWTYDSPDLVHEDFTNALNKLKPHMIVLGDMREMVKTWFPTDYALEDLEHIHIDEFGLAGTNDGVSFGGWKEVDDRIIPISTPMHRYDSEKPYKYSNELASDIEDVLHEVKLYMNGKHAEKPQMEMEFEEEEGLSTAVNQ